MAAKTPRVLRTDALSSSAREKLDVDGQSASSVALFCESLRQQRTVFNHLASQNRSVRLYALISGDSRPDEFLVHGSNARALSAWTFAQTTGGKKVFWNFAFVPPPRRATESDSLWDIFKPVGRVCRTTDVRLPLLTMVGDTRDDDFWLMLLFHAAWSAPPGLAFTAFNEHLREDGPCAISLEQVRALAMGLRSELSVDPLTASGALVDFLCTAAERHHIPSEVALGRAVEKVAALLVNDHKLGDTKKQRSKPKQTSPRSRSSADRVRELLSGAMPYEGTKTRLAQEVGYTHQASLSNVKNFALLWDENERKLATAKAERQKRMVPTEPFSASRAKSR